MRRRILAVLLSICVLMGMLPAVAMAEETSNKVSKKTILTAFSGEAVTIDGAISDQGWQMHDLGDGVSLGAQWQKKNLLLAIGGQIDSLTVNEKPVPLEGTEGVLVASGGTYQEMSLSMAWLGLLTETQRPEIGDEIPVSVTVDDAPIELTLKLSDVDWYAVENPSTVLTAYTSGKTSFGVDASTDQQGITKIDTGYELYDLYDGTEGAGNPAKIRTYMVYQTKQFAALLQEHDQPIYVEFDFCADTLPDFGADPHVMDGSSANKLYSNYGLSLVVADAYDDPANKNYWSTLIRVGLCNIGGEINFASYLNSGKYSYTPLGKAVGEKFRLGISWEMDGSVAVSVDGAEVAHIAGVETSLHWYVNECIAFNLIRNDQGAASSADDMRVRITNLAAGKRYNPYTVPTVVAEGPSAAAYASNSITMDGKHSEKGWLLNNLIYDEENTYQGKFGAQWDQENLYLALNTAQAEATVEFGRTVLTIDMESATVSGKTAAGDIPAQALTVAVSGDTAELAVPLRVLDIVDGADGQLIPIVVRFGEAAFSGELVLRELYWFVTDLSGINPTAGVTNIQNTSRVGTSDQGSTKISGGYQIYDKYKTANHSGSGRTYVNYQEKPAYFGSLDDHTQATYTEFEFQAENLPVYTSNYALDMTRLPSFACRGFAWAVGDAVNSTNGPEYISLGIYRDATGLVLVVKTTDGNISLPLNKKVGDKFRIGTMLYPNGSLDVYLDGELFTQSPIANALRTGTVIKGGISLNTFCAEKTVTSAAEDIIVNITNIVMAKQVQLEQSTQIASPATIETAYTSAGISLDGEITEQNWLMNNPVGSGKLGALWDAENLYLAVDPCGEELSLSVNGNAIVLNDTNSKTQTVTEVKLSLKDLGVTVYDYGTLVPINVTVGDVTVSRTLKLIAGDWFLVEKADAPIAANKQGSTGTGVTTLQGFKKIEGGYRLYDLWDPAGENPTGVRTYLMKIGTSYNSSGVATSEGDAKWDPLGDHQSSWVSFDFRADSMPVYAAADMVGLPATYPCYGLSVFMADGYNKYETYAGHNLVAFGIFNSVDGLMLSVTRNSGAPMTVELGKQVGDAFRISAVWLWDEIKFADGAGTLILYVDGEYLVTVEDAQFAAGYVTRADGVLAFNMIRSGKATQSTADDLDISITNLAAGKLDAMSVMELLDWDMIKGENTDPNNITANLQLPAELSDGILTTRLTWTADKEGIIAADGTLSIPNNLGEAVTLTAKLSGTGAEKTFRVIVPGTGAYDGKVTVVTQDQNPADGFGEGVVAHSFVLDENNNSIVLDLETAHQINLVTLVDGDEFARLRRDNLTLWYESDGEFVQIKDFKLKHDGTNWYLYGFSVNTRYIKVHSTHYDGREADFSNALENMIRASWEASLEATGAYTVSVPATTLKDQAAQINLPEGVAAEKLRVSLNGKLLYHYVQDGQVLVQIPNPTDGELRLWNGGTDSIELSNKEYVYEVSYGVREAWAVTDTHWIQTLNDGTMVGIVTDKSLGYDQKVVTYSYDGGKTWEGKKFLDAANSGASETQTSFIDGGGNFTYDRHTGRLIFHGTQAVNIRQETDASGNKKTLYELRTNFIASDDGGKTWYQLGTLEAPYDYVLSYTAGLELSTYDGAGPNVDFVFSLATWHPERTDGTMCTLVAYSTDAGTTWQVSDGYIATERSTNNSSGNNSEGGASEATIMESDYGTLVLYTRYQADKQMHFAVSRSYDHGITWQTGAELSESNVYTTNTQPMFYSYDGAPLLVWGGNNAVDRDGSHTVGNSYIRTPMSVAVSYDGGDSFGNIQDLYAGYSMQGLTFATQHCIINPMVQKGGEDSLLICYWDQFDNRTTEKTMLMRVDDFTDFFYRNKGAYDSFEHGTVKYEGWDIVAGSAAVSPEQQYDGAYSVKLQGATAVRSVPYMQRGSISLQVYPTSNADLTISLQAAYSNVTDRSAPVNVVIPGDALVLNQWNAVEIRLDLTGESFAVTATVAGKEVTPQICAAAGNYVCFVTLFVSGTVYVDDVLVTEDMDAQVYGRTIEAVEDMIGVMPETITGNSKYQVEKIREAYDALTAAQQAALDAELLSKLTAAEEKLTELVKSDIYQVTLTLEDYIGINVYVKKEAGKNYSGCHMIFTHNGKEKKATVAAEETADYIAFTYRINAKEMADIVSAQFVFDNGESLSRTVVYSAATYAKYVQDTDHPSYTAALKQLAKDMVQYGACAQKYFGYNTGKAADANVSGASDISAVKDANLASYMPEVTNNFLTANGISLSGSLLLQDFTVLRFSFKGDIPEGVRVLVNGAEVQLTSGEDRHYVDVKGIAAKDLDQAVTLTITLDGETMTVKYNPMSYCYNVLKGNYSDELKDLVRSLYLYNQSANAYFPADNR